MHLVTIPSGIKIDYSFVCTGIAIDSSQRIEFTVGVIVSFLFIVLA